MSTVENTTTVARGIPNNAYLALEGVWRDSKKRISSSTGGGGGVIDLPPSVTPRSMSPISMSSSSTTNGDDTAHKLNLSAICISNILMLEDKHIPSIFIRMYEYCLQRNDETPDDSENNARLRLLNYMFQRWHETRNRLTFYRDVFKVVSVVAKPIIGEHMSIAVEMSPINQQHVMRELIRSLRKESRGQTLGEFLERYGTTKPGQYTFHDMGLELFTREDVLEYESMGNSAAGTNVVHSFIGDLLRHPIASYFNRLLLTMTRSLCHLRLNMPASVSNKLFSTSVPSWAEEDTETGMINMDADARERLRQTRENITRLLTKRKIKMIEQRQQRQQTKQQEQQQQQPQQQIVNTNNVDSSIKENDNYRPTFRVPDASKERNIDDYHTIDTESFIGDDNATLYSESVRSQSFDNVADDRKMNRSSNNQVIFLGTTTIATTTTAATTTAAAATTTEAAVVTTSTTSLPLTTIPETDTSNVANAAKKEILETERNLVSLLSKKLSRNKRQHREINFEDMHIHSDNNVNSNGTMNDYTNYDDNDINHRTTLNNKRFKQQRNEQQSVAHVVDVKVATRNNNVVRNKNYYVNDESNNNDDNGVNRGDENYNSNNNDEDDNEYDDIVDPPANVIMDNTVTTLQKIDRDIMRLSEYTPETTNVSLEEMEKAAAAEKQQQQQQQQQDGVQKTSNSKNRNNDVNSNDNENDGHNDSRLDRKDITDDVDFDDLL